MLAPLLALAAAAAAQPAVSYTAALTLEEGGRLRAVETFRPLGDALCGELSRELPLKRLGPDGLRRLAAVEVAGAYRGSGAGLRPAGWRLERTPRGARVVVDPAPAPPDCAAVLMTVGPAFLRPAPGGSRLRFALPGAGLGAPLASAAVGLAGLGAPVRLIGLERGVETPLASGTGSAVLGSVPEGLVVAEADLPEPPPPAPPGRLLRDNLHVAAGLAGLAGVLLLYALGPRPRSHDGRPWGLLAAGGALSSGTVAAMRLAEDPAAISGSAALEALAAGLGAGLAGAAVLALWGLVVVLVRSASRPGAPRPAVLHLAGAAAGFTAFGLTTGAADLLTRLVRDAAPAAVLAGALHLALHAAAFVLKRAPEDA
jgi:hypothetical protein